MQYKQGSKGLFLGEFLPQAVQAGQVSSFWETFSLRQYKKDIKGLFLSEFQPQAV